MENACPLALLQHIMETDALSVVPNLTSAGTVFALPPRLRVRLRQVAILVILLRPTVISRLAVALKSDVRMEHARIR